MCIEIIKRVFNTATNTKILVLLAHAYPHCENARLWLTKSCPGIVINIKTIFLKHYLANFTRVPLYYCLWGTIYLFAIVKTISVKKMGRLSIIHLLWNMGTTTDSLKRLERPKLFFQAIWYSGKEVLCLYSEKALGKSKI